MILKGAKKSKQLLPPLFIFIEIEFAFVIKYSTFLFLNLFLQLFTLDLIVSILILFTEITPYFEPRNVTVKKGVDAKEIYNLLTEIGR